MTPAKKTSETPKEAPENVNEKTKEEHPFIKASENTSPVDEEERFLSAIGYIGFLCILPLMKKDSEFCQWHGRQALVFNCALFLIGLFLLAIPYLFLIGPLVDLFKLILFGGALVVILFAYESAKKGGKWKIPYIQSYVEKLPKF